MRALMLCALVALVAGCALDFPGLTALDDAALEASEQAMVDEVRCSADSLAIEGHEAGVCQAFNAVGTRIQVDDFPAVVSWSSSAPASVSVALDGEIRAESEPGDAWIYAEGTHESVDSVRVTAH